MTAISPEIKRMQQTPEYITGKFNRGFETLGQLEIGGFDASQVLSKFRVENSKYLPRRYSDIPESYREIL